MKPVSVIAPDNSGGASAWPRGRMLFGRVVAVDVLNVASKRAELKFLNRKPRRDVVMTTAIDQ